MSRLVFTTLEWTHLYSMVVLWSLPVTASVYLRLMELFACTRDASSPLPTSQACLEVGAAGFYCEFDNRSISLCAECAAIRDQYRLFLLKMLFIVGWHWLAMS